MTLAFPKPQYRRERKAHQAAKQVLRKSFSEAVMALDKYRCQYPGCRERVVTAHHIIHRSQQGPDTKENGITLCAEHHGWVQEGHIFHTGLRPTRMSGKAIMLFVLGKYIADPRCRWRGVYEELKRRKGR